jgi:1,4-alpha-glucan branching enzyme
VPGAHPGDRYRFALTASDDAEAGGDPEVGNNAGVGTAGRSPGTAQHRPDPRARATEGPPGWASRIHTSTHAWGDDEWMQRRRTRRAAREPLSIYECHLESWSAAASYRELAAELPPYAAELGFTHVELLPVAEHPFAGSWGYQATGYFVPTARLGEPDDFRALVDALHQHGVGVLVDWVPGHFPADEWALADYDGAPLYEDPARSPHPDWDSLEFALAEPGVRAFLLDSALFWIEECHIDGLRVDGVSSMLYLDYSRDADQWRPNAVGSNENLAAIGFLTELTSTVHTRNPGVILVAEESSPWPGVTRPVQLGGLGFDFKWDMGWMHDTLAYFARDPVFRRHHHGELTFGLSYSSSEDFVLALSHDEVVHGKASLIEQMAGDHWHRLANLRAMYAYAWARPGKPLVFMGAELGQHGEWNADGVLEWGLLAEHDHAGLARFVAQLNAVAHRCPALWRGDDRADGFRWIEPDAADHNLLAFTRFARGSAPVVCVANFSGVSRSGVRTGLPRTGEWRDVLNSDDPAYGGADLGADRSVQAAAVPAQGMPASATLTLPRLATRWLTPVAAVHSASAARPCGPDR